MKSRDDVKLYNTTNEHKLLAPETSHYQNLAIECVKNRVCVDIFYALNTLFKSIDVASVSPITSTTGGDLYYY